MLFKKIISFLFLSFWGILVFGQTFLNGDFEINTAVPNTNYMMMSSSNFEAAVPNCYSGGTIPNLDLLAYLGTFQPQSGEWFIGITPQDILTLEMDQDLVAGETYTMVFYDMHKEAGSLIDIGVSMDAHTFGSLVYTTPQIPSLFEWKVRIFTFIAPMDAQYINIRQQDTGNPLLWVGVDNFTIESEGCTKTISLGSDTVVCTGQNIILQATGSIFSQYVWNDGSTGSTKTVTQPSTYWVTGLAGVCTVSDTVIVSAGEVPDVDFESNIQTGCGSLLLTFSYVGLVDHHNDYYWQFGDGTYADEAMNLHYYAASGCYDVTLTVTSDDGCSNTLTKDDYICVDPNPIANFYYSPDPVFVDNPIVQFQNTSVGNITNQWDFGNGQTSLGINPSHTFPSNSGDYPVTLTVSSPSGCTSSITKNITIKHPFDLYVPNSFTPNDDGINDILIPMVSQPFDIYEYTLEIFNRWGERVFSTADIVDGWNGDKGQQGLYVWKISTRHPYTKQQVLQTGRVMLLR